MSLEGILYDSSKPLLAAQIDPEGMALYAALSRSYQMVISTLQGKEEEVRYWLEVNGVRLGTDRVPLLCATTVGDTRAVRKNHIHIARSLGPISWFVDADPDIGQLALSLGVRPLICPRPLGINIEPEPATWAQVEAELEVQRAYKEGLALPDVEVEDIDWEERGFF